MPRDLTTNAQTRVDKRYANEAHMMLKVEWPSNDYYYTENDDTFVDLPAGASLVNHLQAVGEVSTVTKVGNTGEYSSASISIIDPDGHIAGLMKDTILEGTDCVLYHYFRDLNFEDAMPLLRGRLTDLTWSEETHTVSFTVESYFNSELVGYKPELDAFAGFNNDVAGQAWPFCVGTVLEVPCVRVQKYGVSSELAYQHHNSNNSLIPTYEVQNGNYIFPLGSEIDLIVGGIKFRGTMVYSYVENKYRMPIMRIDEKNLPIYENILTEERVASDPDFGNNKVVWVNDTTDLTQQFVLIDGFVNYCEQQEGNKAIFRKQWPETVGVSTISETAGVPREDWTVTYTIESGDDDFGGRVYRQVESEGPYLQTFQAESAITPDRYLILKGASVTYNTPGAVELHLCNLFPSSEIVDVWASRSYNNKNIFVPVPSSRYTKHLNYSLNGKNITALEFARPLTIYESELWDDQIYVSVRSSIPPNTVTAIKYVIENFTNLTVDQDSFDYVATWVQDFWMCFVLTDTIDAMDLVNEMARQARCSLLVSGHVVKIVFLPVAPLTNKDLGDDWIGSRSLVLSTQTLDDVSTVVTAGWSKKHDDTRKYIYRNNESIFGSIETDEAITMYNMEYCVQATIDFWGYRNSNIWRNVALRSFLNTIDVELHDTILLDTPHFSTNQVRGVIQSVKADSNEDITNLLLEMASRPSDAVTGEPVEDPLYWPGNPEVPDIKDPAYGRDEVDYVPPVVRTVDSEEEDQPANDHFEFTIFPDVVERGESFTMEIRVFDSDNIPQTLNTSATLQLLSADGSDVINLTNIDLIGGVFFTNAAQITGGSDVDPATLQVVGPQTIDPAQVGFTIVDLQVPTMAWTVPATVSRNVDFSVTLISGPPNQAVDIFFYKNDISDRVYKRSTGQEVTSVTLDGAGGYFASDWYINGGSGDFDFGYFTAHDPNFIYADAKSDQFTIGGFGDIFLSHTVKFEQSNYLTNYDLELAIGLTLVPGVPFGIAVQLLFAGGIATGFTGTATLKLWSATDEAYLPWTQGGPLATVSGPDLQINIVAGEWLYEDCEVDFSGISGTELELQGSCYIPADNNTVTDTALTTINQPLFLITLPPTITRGVLAACTVLATNSDGSIITDYNNISALPLVVTSAGGLLTSVPTEIPIGSFVDGYYAFDLTFSGGAGSDQGAMGITDDDVGISGDIAFEVEPVTVAIPYATQGSVAVDLSQFLQPLPVDDAHYQGLQVEARQDFPGAVIGSSLPYGMFDAGWHTRCFSNAGDSGYYAGGGSDVIRREITADFKANAYSAYITVSSRVYTWLNNAIYDRWNHGNKMYVLFADSQDKLDSGNEIQGLNGDAVFTLDIGYLNALAKASGAINYFHSSWYLPDSILNYLKNLPGTYVYSATYVDSPVQPLDGFSLTTQTDTCQQDATAMWYNK